MKNDVCESREDVKRPFQNSEKSLCGGGGVRESPTAREYLP